jgi:hypothetical protein
MSNSNYGVQLFSIPATHGFHPWPWLSNIMHWVYQGHLWWSKSTHQLLILYVAFRLVLYRAYVELPQILSQPIFNIFPFWKFLTDLILNQVGKKFSENLYHVVFHVKKFVENCRIPSFKPYTLILILLSLNEPELYIGILDTYRY